MKFFKKKIVIEHSTLSSFYSFSVDRICQTYPQVRVRNPIVRLFRIKNNLKTHKTGRKNAVQFNFTVILTSSNTIKKL